jgi:hypothetical protein
VQTETGVDPSVSLVFGARRLAAATAGGFLAGLLIGGVGGRLAMLLLRVTSDASLHGLETDDGFEIGVFTGATAFLLGVTALLGAIGGVFYLVARRWIPPLLRPWTMGVLAGAVGGVLVLRPGELDFTLLEPLLLAVILFVALPALYGVALALLVERLLREDSIMRRRGVWIAGLLPLVPLVLFGGVGVLVVLVGLAAWWTARTFPVTVAWWRSSVAMWIGRAILATVGVASLVGLVGDVVDIL